MAKQQIQQKETVVAGQGGVGQQLERTYTVDDNSLPSPQELAAYKEIDPQIVTFLMEASAKEQDHRHKMDKVKFDLVRRSESRTGRMNWWGMAFAFLSIVVIVALAAYALYLNRPWFAGILGAGTLVTVASIFINKEKPDTKKK